MKVGKFVKKFSIFLAVMKKGATFALANGGGL